MLRLRPLACLVATLGLTVASVLGVPGASLAAPVPLSGTPGTIETAVGGTKRPSINDPQDLARSGNTLFIADAGRNVVWARDLVTGATTIVAGTYDTHGAISGLGGAATAAVLPEPDVVGVDGAGNLYIGVNGWSVYRVDPGGTIELFAGAGAAAADGDGGLATAANVGDPRSLAADAAGNVYIADALNCVIRRVDPAGVITTVAGAAGVCADTGDLGLASVSTLDVPQSIAVDASDHLFVLTAGARVRRVDRLSGLITTVAGTGTPGYDGDGGVPTSAEIGADGKIAVAPDGTLLIANTTAAVVRRVDLVANTITTVAGTGVTVSSDESSDDRLATTATFTANLRAIASGADGTLYLLDQHWLRRVDPGTQIISEWTRGTVANGDGGPAHNAILDQPWDVLRVGEMLYVADGGAHQIRAVDLETGVITTIAGTGERGYTGDGGPAAGAKLIMPIALAHHDQALYFSDVNRIRRIDLATGVISTVAGSGLAIDPSAFAGMTASQIDVLLGDGGPATMAPLLVGGLDFTRDGRMLIADPGSARIRQIDTAGIITTIAGSVPLDMTTLNEVHTLTTYTRAQADAAIGDGGLATDARLMAPYRVTEAPDGRIVFSDMILYRVRALDPATGIITTIAGGGAVSGPNGDGGDALDAVIAYPVGVRVDAAGNLEILAGAENRVRRVDATTNVITTIAGNGNSGYAGDGGPATSAEFHGPIAITADAGTHLYVVDMENAAIRRIEGARPNLVVDVSDPGLLSVGATGRVAVAVTNGGAGWATGPVVAEVTLPAGLEYVGATSTQWSCAPSSIGARCTSIESLAPSSARTFDLDVRATGAVTGSVPVTIVSRSDSDDLDPTRGIRVLGITITAAVPVVTTAPGMTAPPSPTAPGPESGAGTGPGSSRSNAVAGALPRTGHDAGMTIVAALGLVLVGGLCLVGVRLRRRPAPRSPVRRPRAPA